MTNKMFKCRVVALRKGYYGERRAEGAQFTYEGEACSWCEPTEEADKTEWAEERARIMKAHEKGAEKRLMAENPGNAVGVIAQLLADVQNLKAQVERQNAPKKDAPEKAAPKKKPAPKA